MIKKTLRYGSKKLINLQNKYDFIWNNKESKNMWWFFVDKLFKINKDERYHFRGMAF